MPVSDNVKRLMASQKHKAQVTKPKPRAINTTDLYKESFKRVKHKLYEPYTELSKQEQLIWSCNSFELIVAKPYFEARRHIEGVPATLQLIDKVVAQSWAYHYHTIKNVIPPEYKSFMDKAEVLLLRLQEIYNKHNLVSPNMEKQMHKRESIALQIKNLVPIMLLILNRKKINLTTWDNETLSRMQALIESYIRNTLVKYSDKGYQELL